MLYQIIVKVESEAIYHQPYKLEIDNFILGVMLSPDKVVEELSIALRVKNYQDFLPQVSSDIESQITRIDMRDSPLCFLLVDLAQHIEALGSFWFGIKKIYWESPKRAWIAESFEEQEALEFSTHDFQQESHENKCYREMSPGMLASLVQNRLLHQHLVLPMSFYREACNDFSSGRYTSSFINFYFYLDDLYGQGKTKNKEVEKLFKSSEHIRKAIEQTIQLYQNVGDSENFDQLKKFLDMEKCEFNVDGIIELIVQVRGNLSHFSQKSSKKKGHPLNQREFRSMAYLINSICIHTFIELTTGEMPK
ncbi:hypothetical protein [Brasilonema octagenarum]|uniref:ApeA N-terminal domain-containing protein n=1 Tax=Brasilonema octagenarum UFV-OR1 TaxID=417115 RepID=A0ABX1M8M0_9CYAN|nr:hypothetical protein [Brasilonema octagenarum]NMF64913.1 hypothetical protein [Brasilonema octagenarum UFV-OR1]